MLAQVAADEGEEGGYVGDEGGGFGDSGDRGGDDASLAGVVAWMGSMCR